MKRPEIYRKRYIPEELINLKDDVLCHRDEAALITKWVTLKPRTDFASGISLYLMDKGFKISRISDTDGNLVHYYCDIIHTDYYAEKDTYIFTDLLADVVVFKDGSYTVLDLDELGDVLEQGIIDIATASEALHKVNALITELRRHEFVKYINMLEEYI